MKKELDRVAKRERGRKRERETEREIKQTGISHDRQHESL